jgi:hypothetical protein
MANSERKESEPAGYESTVVSAGTRIVESPVAGAICMCEELMTLKLEAVHVFREVKKIRRSRDVSFCEDTELNREKHNSINAIIKHLLVGHEGKPCPGGDSPL